MRSIRILAPPLFEILNPALTIMTPTVKNLLSAHILLNWHHDYIVNTYMRGSDCEHDVEKGFSKGSASFSAQLLPPLVHWISLGRLALSPHNSTSPLKALQEEYHNYRCKEGGGLNVNQATNDLIFHFLPCVCTRNICPFQLTHKFMPAKQLICNATRE